MWGLLQPSKDDTCGLKTIRTIRAKAFKYNAMPSSQRKRQFYAFSLGLKFCGCPAQPNTACTYPSLQIPPTPAPLLYSLNFCSISAPHLASIC